MLEEKLYRVEEKKLINAIPCGIAVYKFSEVPKTLYFSDGVCRLTGHNREEYEDIIKDNAFNIIEKVDKPLLERTVVGAIEKNKNIDFSYRIIHKNGNSVWVHLAATKISEEDGCPIYYAVFMDISEEREIQAILKKRAEHDSLTGLYNRLSYEIKVNEFLKKNEDCKAAFAMIDVDDFKKINDELGHTRGDEALCKMSQTLVSSFGDGSFVARMGGDEFSIFIPNIESMDVLRERLDDFFVISSERCKVLNEKITISYSMGVSIYPTDGKDFHHLYLHADKALLYAKNMGKNQYRFYQNYKKVPVTPFFGNMNWVIDEDPSAIYICDAETYDIIYVNKAGMKLLDCNDEYMGKKCYEFFMNREEQCPFCKSTVFKEHEYLERKVYVPELKKEIKTNGKISYWNGRKVHIEFITDLKKDEIEKRDFPLYSFRKAFESNNMGMGVITVCEDKIESVFLDESFYRLFEEYTGIKETYIKEDMIEKIDQDSLRQLILEVRRAINNNKQIDYDFEINKIYNEFNIKGCMINLKGYVVKEEDKIILNVLFSRKN